MKKTAKSFYERGFERLQQKDYDGAFEDFKKVLRKEPSFSQVYYQLAMLEFELKRYGQATFLAKKALSFKKNDEPSGEIESFLAEIDKQQNRFISRKLCERFLELSSAGGGQINFAMAGFYFPGAFLEHQNASVLMASKDGLIMIGRNNKEKIEILDLITREVFANLRGGDAPVLSIVDLIGNQLLMGSASGEVKLWNYQNQTLVKKLGDHESPVRALAFSGNELIASGSDSGLVCIWDYKLLKMQQSRHEGHQKPVRCLAFLGNNFLISAADDKKILIVDIKNKKCTAILNAHDGNINFLLVLSPEYFLSASSDRRIKLWDIKGNEKRIFSGHTGSVNSLLKLNDSVFLSASSDGLIKLWNKNKEIFLKDIKVGGKIVGLQQLSDNRLVISSLNNETGFMIIHFSELVYKKPVLTDDEENMILEAIPRDKSIFDVSWEDGEQVSSFQEAFEKINIINNKPLLERQDKIKQAISLADEGQYESAILLWERVNTIKKLDTEEQRLYEDAQKESKRIKNILSTLGDSLGAKAARVEFFSGETSSTIPYNEIKFSQTILGAGGFGVVCQAQWQHIDVAVKQLKVSRMSDNALEEFKQEAACHAGLRHPNIVTLYGVCLEHGRYSMVMELMVKGSLYQLLHNNEDLPWNLRLMLAKDMAVGLAYLHAKGIVHGDLKSMNVLLDDRLRAKISDFGLSRVKHESSTLSTPGSSTGTLCWMAPELFERGGKCSTASDVYALGIIFWELASRKLPFTDAANSAIIMQWVKQGEREKIPEETPPKLARLIAECWKERTDERPVADQIISVFAAEEPMVSNVPEASGYQVFSQ